MKLKKIILLFLICVVIPNYSMEFFGRIFSWWSGRRQQMMLNTKLYDAVVLNRVDEVRDLLEKGARANCLFHSIGGFRMSFLMFAAMFNRKSVAELLLEKGADPNFAERGDTALIEAACSNAVEIAQLLIQKGAFINVSSINLLSGLEESVLSIVSDKLEMVQLILGQISRILTEAGHFERDDVINDEIKEKTKNIDFTGIYTIGMLYESLNRQIYDALNKIYSRQPESIEILYVFYEFILRHEGKLPGLRKKIEHLIRLTIKYREESFRRHIEYIRH